MKYNGNFIKLQWIQSEEVTKRQLQFLRHVDGKEVSK